MSFFQSYEYRDGQYTARTIGLEDIIKNQSSASKAAPLEDVKPPVCGVLTRTIVESPVVHWILPARLRSAQCNDVAFVGDYFVQINELRRDQQLHPIIRKSDFGSRIRNVKVIGVSTEHRRGGESTSFDAAVKLEEERDVSMQELNTAIETPDFALPPQMLLLVLESGASLFLIVRRKADDELEFCSFRFDGTKNIRNIYPGVHAAVDPSSRYLALACAEGLFVVYELEARSKLQQDYATGQSLKPVVGWCPRPVNGVIHKMEFLFPRPEDDYHIILLLIIVKNAKSRMVIFEWELGDSLQRVLEAEKPGYRLPSEHQMPLMIVPLTVHTSFFAVSQNSIAVCKDALQGPPNFEEVENTPPSETELHHGIAPPLWTAWARPFRRRDYHQNKDNIFLAREDGSITFLEINSTDILASSLPVGNFNCNISRAFTTVWDTFYDILIMGGDSGPGAIWKLPPREAYVQIGAIPNWSPVVDFVTTSGSTNWNMTRSKTQSQVDYRRRKATEINVQDRIFATSGRGVKGTVTEYRHGIQADLHLDIDFESHIRQIWTFSARICGAEDGIYVLLAVPEGSDLLHISGDFLKASKPDESESSFDIQSRTLAAAQISESTVVQVSKQCITIISGTQGSRFTNSTVLNNPDLSVEHAAIRGSLIALATQIDVSFKIHLLGIETAQLSVVNSCSVEGEITSLALCSVDQQPCVVAGIWHNNQCSLAVYSVHDATSAPLLVDLDADATERGLTRPILGMDSAASSSIEQIVSIAVVEESQLTTRLALGTRNGYIITVRLYADSITLPKVQIEKLADERCEVFKLDLPSGKPAALTTCESSMVLVSNFEYHRKILGDKTRVWITDASNPVMSSPPVRSLAILPHTLSGQTECISLALLTGTRILFVDLHFQPGPVPRYLPLNGTPSRILFSKFLDCIIVAVSVGNKPNLMFLDLDTGDDLLVPTDKQGNEMEYVHGLGMPDDRILALHEWLYQKDGKTWLYVIVTTHQGRLLILSTQKIERRGDDDKVARSIRCWTRYKKKGSSAIYSIAVDAENLFYCMGKTLHWETLELEERQIKPMKEMELDSPAQALRIVNNRIQVLTTKHSLLVIDYAEREEMTLLCCDPVERHSTYMIDLGASEDSSGSWPITLICDRLRGFAGFWMRGNNPGQEFEVIFEGQLPASVTRLRLGHIRPSWIQQGREPSYGAIPSTVDDADVIGISIDGSMFHFTLLTWEAWKLLSLIQNLALASPITNPHMHKPPTGDEVDLELETDPKTLMQVDGDVLQRCLDQRALQVLIESHSSGPDLFREYLDRIDDGKWTDAFSYLGSMAEYYTLGYDILEYFLAPLM